MRQKINNASVDKLNLYLSKYLSSKSIIKSREVIKNLTYKSVNYGDFMIIDSSIIDGRYNYTIKFLSTGSMYSGIRIGQIRTGNVKDYNYPVIYDVGYLGDNYKNLKEDIELYKYLYLTWVNMISRCYNKKSVGYNRYGAIGVTVDKRWHCFENFFNDCIHLPGYDRDLVLAGKLSLDKDGLQQNVKYKIYSNKTCMFITQSEQNYLVDHRKAQSKLYKKFIATDDQGNSTIEIGIGEFARKNHLDRRNCSKVLNSGKKSIGKFTLKYID